MIFFTYAAFGQETDENLTFNGKGFVDTYHAARTQLDGKYMSSRTRVRLEGNLGKNGITAFASLNVIYNPLLKDQTGFFLREAYVGYQQNGFDMKFGKQIITWGIADGLQLTDIISPMDYTEFLAQDYDDIRVPVTALRLGYGNQNFHIEGVFSPIPEFFILPTDTINPWSIRINEKSCLMNEKRPNRTLANSEYGLRASFYFSGFDFSLSALRTFNKMPALCILGMNDKNQLLTDAEYARMDMIGADFSVPFGKIIIRGEAAEYFKALQSSPMTGNRPIKKNQTTALIGVDWYPGKDWTLMLQYNHNTISDYENTLSNYRNYGMATVNIKKDLMRNLLKLSAFGRFDCANNGAFFIRFNADYQLSDQLAISGGYDWFNANKGTFFMYRDNSEVFIKAKYCF